MKAFEELFHISSWGILNHGEESLMCSPQQQHMCPWGCWRYRISHWEQPCGSWYFSLSQWHNFARSCAYEQMGTAIVYWHLTKTSYKTHNLGVQKLGRPTHLEIMFSARTVWPRQNLWYFLKGETVIDYVLDMQSFSSDVPFVYIWLVGEGVSLMLFFRGLCLIHHLLKFHKTKISVSNKGPYSHKRVLK